MEKITSNLESQLSSVQTSIDLQQEYFSQSSMNCNDTGYWDYSDYSNYANYGDTVYPNC